VCTSGAKAAGDSCNESSECSTGLSCYDGECVIRGLIHEIGFWTWIAIVIVCCVFVAVTVLVIMCCKTNSTNTSGGTLLTFGQSSQKVDLVKALDEIAEMRDSHN